MTPKQFYDWQTAGGTDDVMRLVDCLERADIHGILMRVASLEDTLKGKIKAWKDTARRQSKKLKDLGDIARLVENHPRLWELLDTDLKEIIQEQ
jgi:Nucleotidyl transferase AbiEii toxin, Type IV TA system